jgi:hypothetical protein
MKSEWNAVYDLWSPSVSIRRGFHLDLSCTFGRRAEGIYVAQPLKQMDLCTALSSANSTGSGVAYAFKGSLRSDIY